MKVGGEFLVNTANGGTQQKAEVTGLPDGHFVVVWEDESGVGGDSSRSGIKAQLFEADGTKIGGEILVNTFTPDYQRLPKVAALANGDFVVTWNTANDGNGTSVSAQVFHADGSKFGTEFTANTSTTHKKGWRPRELWAWFSHTVYAATPRGMSPPSSST